MQTSDLPYVMMQRVEEELNQAESLVWAGQPIPWRLAMQTLPVVLFAIPWTAFAVFWMYGAAGFQIPDFREGGASLFPLFGIPFVLVGLGMLAAPFWKIRAAKQTLYLLTNQRAVIFTGGFRREIRSFTPNQLQDLTRKQHTDGSGDLIFKREISHDGHQNQAVPVAAIGFLAVKGVKEVEDKVRALASTAA